MRMCGFSDVDVDAGKDPHFTNTSDSHTWSVEPCHFQLPWQDYTMRMAAKYIKVSYNDSLSDKSM